jgi:type II secretory pathway component PulJ
MQRRTDESGFTILELVIATALLMLVFVVMFNTLWSVQRSEAFTRGRTAAMDNMRVSLNRITKDLRQANDINGTPTPSHLDVDTYINGAPAHVVYDVTGGTITRKVNSGAAVAMHKELTSNAIFTYDPSPDSPDTVTIEVVVKRSNLPDTTLTLSSEIELRNR